MIKFVGYNVSSYAVEDGVIFVQRYDGTWRIYQYGEGVLTEPRVAGMPTNWTVA